MWSVTESELISEDTICKVPCCKIFSGYFFSHFSAPCSHISPICSSPSVRDSHAPHACTNQQVKVAFCVVSPSHLWMADRKTPNVVILSSCRHMLSYYLKISHDRFLPLNSQFVIWLIIIFDTVRAIGGIFKETVNHTERQVFLGV
jgi:hypothetical protein